MKVEIQKSGLGELLRVEMDKGDEFFAQPGAIVSLEEGIEVESRISGGLLSSALRSVAGGESLFLNKLKATKSAVAEFAPFSPGAIMEMDLDGEVWLGDGVYFAHSGNIEVTARFGGLTSLSAGSGLMFLTAKGKGKLYLSAGFGVKKRELKDGEVFTIDNTSFVAANSDIKLTKVWVGKGLISKVVSGEGMMFRFTGPGTVYYGLGGFKNLIEQILKMRSR